MTRSVAAPSLLTLLACLSALPPPTAAHPSLTPRAKETVITDTTDPARPGTLHCFETGTSMNIGNLTTPITSRIQAPIPAVCNATQPYPNTLPGTYSFDYAPGPNPDGTYAHQYITIYLPCTVEQQEQFLGPARCTGGRQPFYPKFDMQLNGPAHASMPECEFAMGRIVQGCPVDANAATQGGWWQFQDDGTSYGLDPTNNVYREEWQDIGIPPAGE